MENRNMKSKKADFLLGEHVVNILIAVLCIIVLIGLGVALLKIFTADKQKIEQAQGELGRINEKLSASTNAEQKYLITVVNGWWLFSDEHGLLCDGEFCLCICKEADCSGKSRACIETDKFVSIKSKVDGEEKRIIRLDFSSELKIKSRVEEVYPFVSEKPVKQYKIWLSTFTAIDLVRPQYFIYIASTKTPLFFRFDSGWKWSPDLDNWMNIETLVVSGGTWDGEKPAQENAEFINFLKENTKTQPAKETGETLFSQLGAHLSKGVYVLEA